MTRRVRRALDAGNVTALDIEVIWMHSGPTVSEGARRLIATGGVLVDALHLQRCGATPEDLEAIEPELLPYAQLCDGPAVLADTSQTALLTDAVDGRLAPGEGELPLRRLVHGLPPGIPLSLEVRSRHYRERFPDPEARARAILDRTRQFLSTC